MSSVEDEGPDSTMVVDEPRRQEGDDDLESVKLITEVMLESDIHQDPAILLMGPANPKPDKYVYSYDILIKLRQSPFSTKRPDYLDTAHDNNGTWDPERWHMERKAAEAPTENGNRNGNGPGNPTDLENHRRRSGDPKDRLRREHDGIVLSPQRRSFNSGCFVPVREPTRNNRSHSPLGGKGADPAGHMGHREISQGPPTRRIGSGRILPWDYQEKNDIDNDFGYRRERRDTDRDRDERFERRSFSRDDPPGPRQPKGPKDGLSGPFNRNNNRYDRRRVSDNKEEEPEWFSEGPISQHDTIELRGFDEADKIKKKPGSQRKKARDKERLINRYGSQKSDEISTDGIKTKDVQPEVVDKEVLQADKTSGGGVNKDGNKEKTTHVVNNATKPDSDDFNLDDFLQSDIPSILRNGIENQSSGSSKFSQWFKRESPVKNSNQSSNSSIDDDQNHVISTILNDITESTVNIPGDAESYFAPISPAANTAPPGVPSQAFIEMLHKSKQQHLRSSQGKNIDPAKMLNLEELEAKIRKAEIGPAGDMRAAHQNVTSETSDENAAFKKLLAQVNAGNLSLASNGPTAKAPPQAMSLMEMLSHSQKQDEAARMIQMMGASGLLPAEIYKHQQQGQRQQHQQMDALVKLMGAQMRQQPRTPPLNDIGIQVASRELLNRPEAQAIFQGLKRGDITPQNLYQQLANPAMQSRHRELLQTILKTLPGASTAAAAPGPSPRVLSPMAPQPQQQHAAFTPQQQQQQQLRVSPLPPVNALHQRIPSPRELQLHTQHIMHNALIKKKLEEQSENFRKKQESQQRAQQGGGGGGVVVVGGGSIAPPSKNVASPTQLAWGTPTSVLRKMTADKDDGKDANKNDPNKIVQQQQGRPLTGMRQPQPTPQQQWNTQYNPQMNNKGRAIVKNNANYQQVQQQQHDQYMLQQRIFNQQQQQQQRKQSQQQQYANMQFGGSGIPQGFGGQTGQFNHQQLRAQHQARAQHQHQAQPQSQPQQPQQPQQQPSQQSQPQQYGQQHQWMLQNQNFDNRQQVIGGNRSGTTDGGEMSPTSNQLARWFSTDLLDRARKGKLPTMPPNLAQHALSLEEIERQASTPAVHN